MNLLYLLSILYYYNAINSEIIFKNDNNELTYNSINLYQNTLINSGKVQEIYIPELDDSSCEFKTKNIKKNSSNNNSTLTTIIYQPNLNCISYISPLSNILSFQNKLIENGYPAIGSIVIVSLKDDLRILGSPSSLVYNPFTKYDNISYILVPDFIDINQISDYKNLLYYDSRNLWTDNLTSINGLSFSISFKVLKFILIFSQIILAGFVASRTKFRGRLQLGLLLVGILQLGGDWLTSLLNGTYQTVTFYSTVILLPAAIINSLVVLNWTNIVYRLNTRVKIQPFRVATIIESVLINVLIILRIILLLALNNLWSLKYDTVNSNWYSILNYFIFSLSCIIPLIMGVSFVCLAMQFCPIFHATARLINAQWFTMFILMTRVSFSLLLVSDHLLKLLSYSPSQHNSFSILNDITLIAYNTMILLTVIKIQSISSVKDKWTPEQLGLQENEDGSITVNESKDTLNKCEYNNDKSIPNKTLSAEDMRTNPFYTKNLEFRQAEKANPSLSYDYVRSVNSSTHSLSN
ncbi:hypothetical protein K502DRAFT_350900 [Neoconidiobolus thromboides FSU 785]|nr:hypothetical protein K502DRAFT_350900 [Neoconidiobolus thromboides FSU 785]